MNAVEELRVKNECLAAMKNSNVMLEKQLSVEREGRAKLELDLQAPRESELAELRNWIQKEKPAADTQVCERLSCDGALL